MDNKPNKKILIVEDEKPMMMSLTDVLTSEGFDVVQAGDGKEGLKVALTKKPDLILLDILMPKMGGMEMMKELRKDAWGKRVKIIILTNLEADDDIMKGITRDEPTFYLVKSDWQISDVLEKVKEVFGLDR